MKLNLKKLFAFLLSFLLCFEQSSFAQVAAQLDIASHLSTMRSMFVQDKFRPLHLRYLQYNPQGNTFRLLLDKGDTKELQDSLVEDTSKTLLRYFLIGVSLPNDSFWVNLRPDSPDNIIDPYLEQTDIGRIMLETDLQLKKDTAAMTSPQTPEGKEYWDKLYKKAEELFGNENITIPTLTRPWIVPDEIIVRETKDSAYIYKATLKVMLEQDYLKDSATYSFKDPRLKELNEYSSQLIRELIIPKLTKEVNSAKRYASLRQIYYSLIMAQWFKGRYSAKEDLYAQLINSKNLNNLTSRDSWVKTAYFKEYQKSFKDGEYNIKEPQYTPFGQTIRSYFSGGEVFGGLAAARIITENGISPELLETDHGISLLAQNGPRNGAGNEDMRRVDFGIDSRNRGGRDFQEIEDYHRQGRFGEVIEDIAQRLRNLGIKMEKERFVDGSLRYDLRKALVGSSPDRLHNIKLVLDREDDKSTELRLEEDGVLVIIDERFQENHAGRGEFAVYARNEGKARHELTELRGMAQYAVESGIATENDIKNGYLGVRFRNYLNGRNPDGTKDEAIDEAKRAQREKEVSAKLDECHRKATIAEFHYWAGTMRNLLPSEEKKDNFDRSFFSHYDADLDVFVVSDDVRRRYNFDDEIFVRLNCVFISEKTYALAQKKDKETLFEINRRRMFIDHLVMQDASQPVGVSGRSDVAGLYSELSAYIVTYGAPLENKEAFKNYLARLRERINAPANQQLRVSLNVLEKLMLKDNNSYLYTLEYLRTLESLTPLIAIATRVGAESEGIVERGFRDLIQQFNAFKDQWFIERSRIESGYPYNQQLPSDTPSPITMERRHDRDFIINSGVWWWEEEPTHGFKIIQQTPVKGPKGLAPFKGKTEKVVIAGETVECLHKQEIMPQTQAQEIPFEDVLRIEKIDQNGIVTDHYYLCVEEGKLYCETLVLRGREYFYYRDQGEANKAYAILEQGGIVAVNDLPKAEAAPPGRAFFFKVKQSDGRLQLVCQNALSVESIRLTWSQPGEFMQSEPMEKFQAIASNEKFRQAAGDVIKNGVHNFVESRFWFGDDGRPYGFQEGTFAEIERSEFLKYPENNIHWHPMSDELLGDKKQSISDRVWLPGPEDFAINKGRWQVILWGHERIGFFATVIDSSKFKKEKIDSSSTAEAWRAILVRPDLQQYIQFYSLKSNSPFPETADKGKFIPEWIPLRFEVAKGLTGRFFDPKRDELSLLTQQKIQQFRLTVIASAHRKPTEELKKQQKEIQSRLQLQSALFLNGNIDLGIETMETLRLGWILVGSKEVLEKRRSSPGVSLRYHRSVALHPLGFDQGADFRNDFCQAQTVREAILQIADSLLAPQIVTTIQETGGLLEYRSADGSTRRLKVMLNGKDVSEALDTGLSKGDEISLSQEEIKNASEETRMSQEKTQRRYQRELLVVQLKLIFDRKFGEGKGRDIVGVFVPKNLIDLMVDFSLAEKTTETTREFMRKRDAILDALEPKYYQQDVINVLRTIDDPWLLTQGSVPVTDIREGVSTVQTAPLSNPMPIGGIDFRSLPIVTQAISNLSLNASAASLSRWDRFNLSNEWQDIERMVFSGLLPSSERIKEYLQASCAKGKIEQDVDKVIQCISDILRYEEERCYSTDPVLRDILVVLEVNRSAEDLSKVFLGKVI